jgi:hypothetical protein
MIIYNVTVLIEESAHIDWVKWMKEKHIPDVLNTGMFLECRFSKVLTEEETEYSYSIQYLCKDQETLDQYQNVFAPALQQEHTEKYSGKFHAFRTLMQVQELFLPKK